MNIVISQLAIVLSIGGCDCTPLVNQLILGPIAPTSIMRLSGA